jgi:hypothetical protein
MVSVQDGAWCLLHAAFERTSSGLAHKMLPTLPAGMSDTSSQICHSLEEVLNVIDRHSP